jgi:Na+-driven multidrug efflux pump
MFHPAYHIINTIMLGHLPDSSIMVASLGLGGVTIGMFLLSVGTSFNMALDTLVA